MKAFLLLCFLIYLATMPAPLLAQNVQPQPLYAVDLSKLISHELDINPAGTLTFLTEHTLAVSICRNLRCNLETLDLEVGSPRVIATTDKFQGYSALFRAADGRVILDSAQSGGERGAILFDSHMDAALLIRKAAGISHISTTGETFVKQGRNGWVAYKIGRPPERIRAGLGSVLSVSDEAVIYVDNGAAHIEGMDRKPLGSFAVTPRALPTVRFLGHDHLWLQNGSQVEILDFNGKPIQTLERPDGWGFRIGQSSDGGLILYDRYTRRIPLAQKIEEDAIAIATMGVGVGDEKPNGEMVLVIETRSGRQCFEWNSSTNLLLAGQFHADIDPSGRLIAIMTRNTLNVYALPEGCVAN